MKLICQKRGELAFTDCSSIRGLKQIYSIHYSHSTSQACIAITIFGQWPEPECNACILTRSKLKLRKCDPSVHKSAVLQVAYQSSSAWNVREFGQMCPTSSRFKP